MKTYPIKDLLKKELLTVELPEEKTINTLIDLEITYGYTLLGKPDEISEDDAKELVKQIGEGQTVQMGGFKNYKNRYLWCKTATESLLSAIESVIFWDVNPLGEKPVFAYDFPEDGPSESMYDSAVDDFDMSSIKWHKAEIRTFDKSRTLIFVKN